VKKVEIIPENFTAAKGDTKGEVNLQWDSVGILSHIYD